MPIQVQIGDTGQIAEFPDGTPTAAIEAALQAQLGIQPQPEQPLQQPGAPLSTRLLTGDLTAAERASMPQGTIEDIGFRPISSVIRGAAAEPIAGLAGLAAAPFVGAEGAADVVAGTKEAISGFTAQPETPQSIARTQQAGETLAPVAEVLSGAEKALGDAALKATGSPALASIAHTLPTATLEAVGFGIGRKVAKTATDLKGAPKKTGVTAKPSERQVTKSLLESAPEVNQIKDASRSIYKEIDDLDVVTKPLATKTMLNKVLNRVKGESVDDVLTPKSARVVRDFKEEFASSRPRSITELDQMRKKAQIAAGSLDPADARVGAIMVDEIDDFLDNMPQKAFSGPDAAKVGQVGNRYKAARKLWGRARRSELITDAFDKAGRQASGFENGIRTQLRAILNNKKRSRFFTKDELSAMDDVVKGTGSANTLKLVGRLGFSEGAATNILGGLGGTAVFGPAAPVIGQISRKLAQKTTQAAANKMDALVRSGPASRKVATAYLQTVPKAKRSAQELSDFLLASGSDVDELLDNANRMVKEAAEIARARKIFQKAEAIGAAVPQAATEATQQEQ